MEALGARRRRWTPDLYDRWGRTESYAISGLHAGAMLWIVTNPIYAARVTRWDDVATCSSTFGTVV